MSDHFIGQNTEQLTHSVSIDVYNKIMHTDLISLSESAVGRINHIKKEYGDSNFLRVHISGGGCSGFQYHFDLDDVKNIVSDDVYIGGKSKVEDSKDILCVTDKTSLEFLQGSVIDFVDELGGSFFKIKNPTATATCGCGSSFSV